MAETDERVSGLFAVRNRSRRSAEPDPNVSAERSMDPRALAIAASLVGLAIGAAVASAMFGIPM